uniref:Leucine rich repeat containing 73 n=1 Tax=Leptobrachium leishanense TaxID=445787 RepID=A0A8C5MWP3_9ANUR
MLPGSIQMSGETLSGAEVKGVCEGLAEGTVRLLSLRGCLLSDRDFARLCQGVSQSPSLVQLNLNLGVVSSASRVQHLAQSLLANRSLHSLFLHGNPLTDTGLSLLNNALAVHPSLVSLDLGDCMLGDEGISLICGLLPPDGAKPGLRELTLSANTAVSCSGWARLAIALAHSSQIRTLNLDYNPLGDHIASMLAVCVASSRTLEVLDLEGTGLTNQSAQTLKRYGVGEGFLSWIHALYSTSSARVRVNGASTSAFQIRNGTRQGCPLSLLLFALSLEPLLSSIRQNSNIKGLQGSLIDHKVSAYTDDLMFFLPDPVGSMPEVIRELRDYGSLSGFKINEAKSEILAIAPPGNWRRILSTQYTFCWCSSSLTYLGIHLTPDFTKLFALNFSRLLAVIKADIGHGLRNFYRGWDEFM